MTKRKTFKKTIVQRLTPSELKALEPKIVELDKEIIAITKVKRDENQKYQGRLNDKKAEHGTYIKALETGEMKREIEVYEQVDERRGHMVFYDAATDKQVDERALTAEELQNIRQGDLFGGKKKGDDDSDDDSDPTTEAPDTSEGPGGQKVVSIQKAKKKGSKKPKGGK